MCLGRTACVLAVAASPDGSRIAFVGGGEDEYYVDVVRSDGSGCIRLAYGGFEQTPTWSPDGKEIAFAVSGEHAEEIAVIGADGGSWRGVLSVRADIDDVAWSPDGKPSYSPATRTTRCSCTPSPRPGAPRIA